MRPILTSLLLLLSGPLLLSGQHPLEGRWEGKITRGGIQSEDGYKFEMYLDIDARGYLTGFATIHLSPVQRIETRLTGKLHQDQSLSLVDLEMPADIDPSLRASFYRKYQLIYHRSIWESTLNGYWQELTPHHFSDQRRRGRIFLKRGKASKA